MAMMLMDGHSLMMSKVAHVALKSLSFKSSKNMEKKAWKLELTSQELAIVSRAVEEFVETYNRSAFSHEDLQSTLKLVHEFNYIG
jgi:hypothetical protein